MIGLWSNRKVQTWPKEMDCQQNLGKGQMAHHPRRMGRSRQMRSLMKQIHPNHTGRPKEF
jgi:hypothetical protein